jgi:hypothetical protein
LLLLLFDQVHQKEKFDLKLALARSVGWWLVIGEVSVGLEDCLAQDVLLVLGMISDRPAEVKDRAVPGHWEGDLLLGGRPAGIAALVEPVSRCTQLVALPDGHRAEPVRVALAQSIASLPSQMCRSLTGRALRGPAARVPRAQLNERAAADSQAPTPRSKGTQHHAAGAATHRAQQPARSLPCSRQLRRST